MSNSDHSNQSPCSADEPTPLDDVEIQIEGLHKSFGTNRVLRGIDLVIRRGEFVAIVGGSGCGKTVLLEHLFRHHQPDRGRVLITDHESKDQPLVDLATLDEEQMDRIRIHWAVVFQHNALFSGSVYDNIALWLREIKQMDEEAIRQRAIEVLQAVGLNPAQVLDLQRDDLSGGMAKRVAVARALSMRPLIMFYDEPTTGLDPIHAAQIHELISATHHAHVEGRPPRTTLIVTHDKDLLHRLRPRVVMLNEGCVYFDGPFNEFEQSESSIIRPYFDLMPILHRRVKLD